MHQVISGLGAILVLSSFATAAVAQLRGDQSNPAHFNHVQSPMAQSEQQAQDPSTGSANLLRGLQERSVKQFSPTRISSHSTPISKANDASDGLGVQLDRNVQLRVKPETDTSQVGVFPGDNHAKGNQFQLIYQFDDQFEQLSRSQR
jgi:hypothetical protein